MCNLRFFVCLMVLGGLIFAIDFPCFPPSFAISKPYSFRMTPNLLHFADYNFAFALESTFGTDLYYYGAFWGLQQLYPFPKIEGYWRYVYKNYGGFVALWNRYLFTNLVKSSAKSYFSDYRFIYALRTGISVLLSSRFVVGIGGDINYALRELGAKSPTMMDSMYFEFRQKFKGHSYSFGIGLTILSHRERPVLTIGYDSKVRVPMNDSLGILRYHYLIPQQIIVSSDFLVGTTEIEVQYYYRFGVYQQDRLWRILAHDLMIDFLIPINEKVKFYLCLYTLPVSYMTTAKGFGFGLGVKLLKTRFFNKFLIFSEQGDGKVWEPSQVKSHFHFYGIRLGFSL